jgi:hypothetical protein
MPYVCSPDSMYVMDSSFELLELTPDVHPATFFSGLNLNNFFDLYDAGYYAEGSSPAMKNLSSLMYRWIDKQDDATRAIILSHNVYDCKSQLNEIILGATNRLVEDYLKNKGIIEIEETNGFIYRSLECDIDLNLNIHSESDIFFPANIATAVLNNNRSYQYITNLKNQLKKSFEVNIPLNELKKHYSKIKNEHNSYSILNCELGLNKKENFIKEYNAKKALKKGIKKFTNLFGHNKIQSFISGEGFTVEGRKYNWHFEQRKTVSILSMTHSPLNGHIPYILTLMTKENLEIANCCVYVENATPIIDQIITIMLYIQHDETELLENCNLFNNRPCLNSSENTVDSIILIEDNFNNKIFFEGQYGAIVQKPILENEYSNQFNILNKKFLPLVKEQFHKIIGLDEKFFNYLTTSHLNPILSQTTEPFFLGDFSESKKLIFS